MRRYGGAEKAQLKVKIPFQGGDLGKCGSYDFWGVGGTRLGKIYKYSIGTEKKNCCAECISIFDILVLCTLIGLNQTAFFLLIPFLGGHRAGVLQHGQGWRWGQGC